jgi:hypothetical protein
VIAVPPAAVPETVAAAGGKGAPAAIIITAGVAGGGGELRLGLCSILKWDDGAVVIKAEAAAIVLFFSVLPDGATECKYRIQRVPIHRTECHLGGQRPWFNCMAYTDGKLCGRRVAMLYQAGHMFACRRCLGLVYASQQEVPVTRAVRRAQKIKMHRAPARCHEVLPHRSPVSWR